MRDKLFFPAVLSSMTGLSGLSGISALAASQLSVIATSPQTLGSAFNVTVSALAASGVTVASYSGTVTFISSDGSAVLPANSTLTNGTGTFAVTLKTAGSQTVTATDMVTTAITGSADVTVLTTDHFSITAASPQTAGTAFDATVTALSSGDVTMTGYDGTVTFTSTDGAAVLPGDSTLTSGVGVFSITLKTTGSKAVTATDAADGAITGTSGTITVIAYQILDNFTDATNNNPLASHVITPTNSPEATWSDPDSAFVINNGVGGSGVAQTATSDRDAFVDFGADNFTLSCSVISTAATGTSGVLLFYTDASNKLTCTINKATGALAMTEYVDGTPNVLGTSTATSGQPSYTFTVVVDGQDVSFTTNAGGSISQTTSLTDNAGVCGLRSTAWVSGALRWDAFSVERTA